MKTAVPLGDDIPQEAVIEGQGALVEADEGQNHSFQHVSDYTPPSIALSTKC